MKKKPAITKPATSSVLALPPTAPPPRKEDIINAMVERARVKHEEQRQEHIARREKAVNELNEALLKELKDKPESFCINFHGSYHAPEIEYILDVVPPHIRKLREKVRDIPGMSGFDAVEVRRKIRDQYQASSSDRVRALLASPDAVKALDAALAKIA